MIQRNLIKARHFISRSIGKVMSPEQPQKQQADEQPHVPRSSFVVFAREIIKNPREMGAACPSSRKLSRALASPIALDKDGLVVELGAGTGQVTQALLQHGIPGKQLVAIERSVKLTEYLKQHFKDVHVVQGDATQLRSLVQPYGQLVNAVVSGLPLRSLPKKVGQDIMNEIEQLLPVGGLYIQFTYDLGRKYAHLPAQFKCISSKFIWGNIPPARVDVYQLDASQ